MEIIILALVLLAALPILITVADAIGRAADRSTDTKPEYKARILSRKGNAMNCGECLIERVEIVPLVDGICPKCGADYRCPKCGADCKPAPQSTLTMEEHDSPDTCAMEGSETDVNGGL